MKAVEEYKVALAAYKVALAAAQEAKAKAKEALRAEGWINLQHHNPYEREGWNIWVHPQWAEEARRQWVEFPEIPEECYLSL